MPNIKTALAILVTIFLAISLGVLAYFLRDSSLDLRKSADGGTGIIDISFEVPAAEVAPGDAVNLPLVAEGLNGSVLQGIQVVAVLTFSNTTPSNLSFTPATIPGLKILGAPFKTNATGGQLLLAFIPDGSGTAVSPTGSLTLGNVTFTAPEGTGLLATFDLSKTKILQQSTGNQLVKSASSNELAFVTPEAAPPENPPQEGTFPKDAAEPDDQNNAIGGGGSGDSNAAEQNQTTTTSQTQTQVVLPKSAQVKIAATATPVPAQPQATAEDLPVTGSSQSLVLAMIGFVFTVVGAGVWWWRKSERGINV